MFQAITDFILAQAPAAAVLLLVIGAVLAALAAFKRGEKGGFKGMVMTAALFIFAAAILLVLPIVGQNVVDQASTTVGGSTTLGGSLDTSGSVLK